MNIKELQDKLQSIHVDGATCTVTLVESSSASDFRLPQDMAANLRCVVSNFNKALAECNPFTRICLDVQTSPNSDFQMEVWLPEISWNERTITVGNSGSANVVNQLALLGGILDDFATFHCNLGTAGDLDKGINNPDVWADFGWRATHLTTEIGKKITSLYYEEEASYHYFYGCSTGGQQGLSAAQHYPADYDGIVAVAPAISRTYLHVYFVWNAQNLINPDGSFVFSTDLVKELSRISIAYFQSLGDGAPGDHFVTNPYLTAEQKAELFKIIEQADFLSKEQLEKLWNIYEGPVNPATGERIYCGFAMGAEMGFFGLNAVKMPGYTYEYLYLPRWAVCEKFDDFDIWSFNFDLDTEKTMKLAPDMNGDSSDLSAFKAAGGKLLMTSGAMDAVVPEPNITNYYHRVQDTLGGLDAVDDFFRYFLVPGFSHSIRGGMGTDYLAHSCGRVPTSARYIPVAYFDAGLVHSLMDWVENDIAPDSILAIGFHEMVAPAGLIPDIKKGIHFQRPVYPYPCETIYLEGDIKSRSSFGPKENALQNPEGRAERYWK